jgi:hypothetical protein
VALLLLPATGLAAPAEERPAELIDLLSRAPAEPWAPESDPCSCLAQLRGCLLAATFNLARCVATNPVGDALCYIKYELDVLLCIYQAEDSRGRSP